MKYYQIYNIQTGETYLACNDIGRALLELDRVNNPHYFDICQQVYGFRSVDERDHPEFGESE